MGVILVASILFVYWILRAFLLQTESDSQIQTVLEADKEFFEQLLSGASSSNTYTF
ncbi:MAG: hypothetical protein QM757_06830 [Paludibaculum sp.]